MKSIDLPHAPLALGDLAPDATVFTSQSERVALASFWQSGPILLTFLRHFG